MGLKRSTFLTAAMIIQSSVQSTVLFAAQTQWQINLPRDCTSLGCIPSTEEKWDSTVSSAAKMMIYFEQAIAHKTHPFESSSTFKTFRNKCPRTVDCRLINTYRSGLSAITSFFGGTSSSSEIHDFSIGPIPERLVEYMNTFSESVRYRTFSSPDAVNFAILNLLKNYPVIANIKVGEISLAREIPADYHQSVIDAGFQEILSMKAPDLHNILLTGYDHSKEVFTYLDADQKFKQISKTDLQDRWLWKLDITPVMAQKIKDFSKIYWVPLVGMKLVTDILSAKGGTMISVDESSIPPHQRGRFPGLSSLPEDIQNLLRR